MKTAFYHLLLAFILMAGFTAKAQTAQPADTVAKKPLRIVEKMPEFPGGQQALFKFIGENVRYPESGLISGVQGVVYASFTVDKTGKVKDAKIIKTIGDDFSAEVLRVIALMPNWSPGISEGEPVPVTYNLPFSFKVKDSGKKNKNIRSYSNNGISFDYLKNWEVSNGKLENGEEIKLEKKGFGNSGTVFITWKTDTTKILNRMYAEINRLSSKSGGAVAFTMGKPEPYRYGSHLAYRSVGTIETNNMAGYIAGNMRIEVYTFNTGGRSFTVKILEFEEDTPENKAALLILENSLKTGSEN